MRTFKIIQSEEQKKNKESPQDLLDIIKRINIYIVEFQKQKRKGYKVYRKQ